MGEKAPDFKALETTTLFARQQLWTENVDEREAKRSVCEKINCYFVTSCDAT